MGHALNCLNGQERERLQECYISIRKWALDRQFRIRLPLKFKNDPEFHVLIRQELNCQYIADLYCNTVEILEKLERFVVKELLFRDLAEEFAKGSSQRQIEMNVHSWAPKALKIFLFHAAQVFNVPTEQMTASHLVELLFLCRETFFESMENYLLTSLR